MALSQRDFEKLVADAGVLTGYLTTTPRDETLIKRVHQIPIDVDHWAYRGAFCDATLAAAFDHARREYFAAFTARECAEICWALFPHLRARMATREVTSDRVRDFLSGKHTHVWGGLWKFFVITKTTYIRLAREERERERGQIISFPSRRRAVQ